MKATLDREALQVALAAAPNDMTRPILECVRIGNGEILAADGFIIAKKHIETTPKKGKEILVKAQDIREAARIIQGNILLETLDDNVAVLKNEAGTIQVKTLLLDGKYPKTNNVIPKKERKAYVALQKKLLFQILKIAEPTEGIVLQFKIREPHEPIEVIADDTTMYVMPIYHPEKRGS